MPFNETELEALSGLFKEKRFTKGQFFAREGEYARYFAFVNEGVLRAFFRTDKGEEYNKTFFTPNNFTGAYSSLITGQKNRINIQCLTDTVLLVGDFQQFTVLFDSYPGIERLARILAEQFFVVKERREIQLVTLEANERYELFKNEHPDLEQQIPQYHIASYLGITPTQLSRIRAKN